MSSITLMACVTVPSGLRSGRDFRRAPALLARAVHAVAGDDGLGLGAAERDAARQAVEGQRPALLVEQLEGAGELHRRSCEQRIRGVEPDRHAEHPHRRVVDVAQPSVRALHRHRVGDAGEDRLPARRGRSAARSTAARSRARARRAPRGRAAPVSAPGPRGAASRAPNSPSLPWSGIRAGAAGSGPPSAAARALAPSRPASSTAHQSARRGTARRAIDHGHRPGVERALQRGADLGERVRAPAGALDLRDVLERRRRPRRARRAPATVPPATVRVRRPRGVSQSSRTFVKRSPRAARTPGTSSSAIGRPSGW